jgi:hypothetical protein
MGGFGHFGRSGAAERAILAGFFGLWSANCAGLGAISGFSDAGNACRRRRGDNSRVDLARLAWLVTVIALLVAVLILALQGYAGYAAVTGAVAVSAAINLR